MNEVSDKDSDGSGAMAPFNSAMSPKPSNDGSWGCITLGMACWF
jgi:hypothetical protein